MAKITPTLIKSIFHNRNVTPFQNLLNLWAVEDAAVIGVDLQFSFIYKMMPPDTRFYGEAELEYFYESVKRMLQALPENHTVQLVARARKGNKKLLDNYAGRPRPQEKIVEYIVNKRSSFLNTQTLQQMDYFLIITSFPSTEDLAKYKFPKYVLTNPDVSKATEEAHEGRIRALKKVADDALTHLKTAKVRVAQLNEGEINEYFYEYLNPSRAALLPLGKMSKTKTFRSQVSLNACEGNFDHIYLDGYYHRAVSMQSRPETIDFRSIASYIDKLEPDYDLCVTVRSLNQDKAINQLKGMRTFAGFMEKVNAINPSYEASMKSAEADELIEHVKTNFQKLFLVSLCVVMRDTSISKLTTSVNKAVQDFKMIGDGEAIIDDMNHLPLFLSALPNHSHLNFRQDLMPTDATAQFMPLCAGWQGAELPDLVIPTSDNQLLPVEFFSRELTAKHGLLLGASGEGKSVITNLLLTSFYCSDEKNHVIVIDDGGSYRRLCRLLKGQYLEPDLNGAYCFNPFISREYAYKTTEEGKPVVDAEFLTFFTTMIQKMLKKADFSNNEKSIIQRAVTLTYETTKEDAPLLGDFQKCLLSYEGDEEDTKIARDFGKNLDLWTTGAFGHLLNRRGTFDVTSRFIVFDLNKLKDEDLKPVVFLIIQSVIYPKLNDKSIRKLIAMDEVWKWLREKVGAAMAEEWFKTGRRFNSAVLVITQSAVDLLKSAAAEAIIENSKVKYVLNLGGGYDTLPSFKFTEQEIEVIKELGKDVDKKKFRKIFLKFGEQRRVVKNILAPTEYWIYTSDADDEAEEKRMREQNPSFNDLEVISALGEKRTEELLKQAR